MGTARNTEDRLERHNSGRGAYFTAMRRPVKLVYQESYQNLHDAIKRERQIKKWSHAKKEALINDELENLIRRGTLFSIIRPSGLPRSVFE